MKQFTSPVKPQVGHAIKADHMQNHARAIEELQRMVFPNAKGKSQRIQQVNLYLIHAGLNSAGDSLVRVTPGYVNGEMPTFQTIPLDDAEFATIIVDEDKYVWLKCVGTFGSPDTYVVTVEEATTDTVPAGTEITEYGFVSFFKVGYAIFNDPGDIEITNTHSGGNLGVDSWGLYNVWWRS